MTGLAFQLLTNSHLARLPASHRSRHHSLRAHITATLKQWARRIRDRRALLEMTARDLRDIGASPSEVYAEISKPFWR